MRHLKDKPWRPILIYLIFGGLWIIFSDLILDLLIDDKLLYVRMQTYKGWFYVALTSVLLYVVMSYDYNEIRRKNNQIKAVHSQILQKQYFIDAVLRHSNIGIVVWDLSGEILEVNDYYCDLTGYEEGYLIGKNWMDIYTLDRERDSLQAMLETLKKGHNVHNFENKIRRHDGSERFTIWNNTYIPENDGKNAYVVSFGIDITNERLHENRILELAYVDQLTGLKNRASFVLEVEKRLLKDEPFTCCYLDIDHFNRINDLHGHQYGDLFLTLLGETLVNAFPQANVYRWAGDDFMILFPYLSQNNDIHDLMVLSNKSWLIKELDYTATFSVGVVHYPEHGFDFPTLYKHLDTALNAAKQQGQSQHLVYNETLTHSLIEQLEMEARLNSALERNAFELVYQPIYRIQNQSLRGVEALLRWPEAPEVTTDVFIGVAEKTGLITKIDEWVIDRALAFASKENFKDRGLMISINISSQSLVTDTFAEMIAEKAMSYNILPQSVEIELTEHTFILDFRKSSKTMIMLREGGFNVALDDFGTQFSTLNYLVKLPFSCLKIDRSYTSTLGQHRNGEIVVESIIQLSNKLGLEIIAEGIETQDQLDRLSQFGCLLGQGYYLSKPLTESTFINNLRGNLYEF